LTEKNSSRLKKKNRTKKKHGGANQTRKKRKSNRKKKNLVRLRAASEQESRRGVGGGGSQRNESRRKGMSNGGEGVTIGYERKKMKCYILPEGKKLRQKKSYSSEGTEDQQGALRRNIFGSSFTSMDEGFRNREVRCLRLTSEFSRRQITQYSEDPRQGERKLQ